MNIQKYILDKKQEDVLSSKIKNYERKIEIMMLKYKHAARHMGLNE